jgi:LacI family transcriptional regulator
MSVSIRDVAHLAGVSIGTVSNVLNGKTSVGAAIVDRVQSAIDELGFVRNDAARQLRAGSSRAIGLIFLDVGNPFFTALARGAEDAAADAGFSVIVGNSDEQLSREAGYLDLFEEQRVRGVLISPVGEIAPRLRRLRANGVPAVLVDRLSKDVSFSSVSVDDVAGGRLAAAHLLERGARRIAFVGGPQGLRQVDDRLAGARAALADAGEPATLESLPTTALTVAEGDRVGRELAARAAPQRPDALFAANDLVAVGLLQALITAGIRVPAEIMVVGYDDIDFASASIVPLSSVRQPAALIGETAVRLLLAETGSSAAVARQIRYQPELIVRDSTS